MVIEMMKDMGKPGEYERREKRKGGRWNVRVLKSFSLLRWLMIIWWSISILALRLYQVSSLPT